MNTLPFSLLPDVANSSLPFALAGGGVAQTSAAIGTAPAATSNAGVPSLPVIITFVAGGFARQGAACLADGTDRYFPPNFPMVMYVRQGNTITLNSQAAGAAYITQGA